MVLDFVCTCISSDGRCHHHKHEPKPSDTPSHTFNSKHETQNTRQDFAEATLKRRGDVIPPSLVKELLPSVASPEAFEALMNEGQGAAVVLGALRQQGGQGGK